MQTIKGYTPFKFQSDSVKIHIDMVENNGGTCILDETGLGKTITSATVAINVTNEPILIVSPLANKEDWIKIMKASGRPFRICTSAKIIDSFFGVIIVDEAHNYRNIKSKSYLELFSLIKRTRAKVILLSATLFQNKTEELKVPVSLIHFKTNTPAFVLLGMLFRDLKQNERDISIIERYKGTLEDPRGNGQSFQDIGKHVTLEHSIENGLKVVANIFATFSHRNTRKSIAENYKDDVEVMGRFPRQHHKKIKHGETYADILKRTVKIIETTPLIMQNIYNFHPDNKDNLMLQMGGIMRSLLLKRLDSSVYAFKKSLDSAYQKLKDIAEYEGLSFIMVNNEEIPVISEFWDFYHQDLDSIKSLIDLWSDRNDDDKVDLLYNELKGQKCIIFTEYKDTLDMIVTEIEKRQIATNDYTSIKAFSGYSDEKELEEIRLNFDANLEENIDTITYLITTDILAEGISLHVAREIIHFDQKWNPSRTKQRNGRIDRILKSGLSTDITITNFEVGYLVESILKLEKAINKKAYLSEVFINNLQAPIFYKSKLFKQDGVIFYPDYPYQRDALNLYRTYCGDILTKASIETFFTNSSVKITYDTCDFGKGVIMERETKAQHINSRSDFFSGMSEPCSYLYIASYNELFRKWTVATFDESVKFKDSRKAFIEFYRMKEREPLQSCNVWLKEHQYLDWE